jgi:hypothetical protein
MTAGCAGSARTAASAGRSAIEGRVVSDLDQMEQDVLSALVDPEDGKVPVEDRV